LKPIYVWGVQFKEMYRRCRPQVPLPCGRDDKISSWKNVDLR